MTAVEERDPTGRKEETEDSTQKAETEGKTEVMAEGSAMQQG